MARKMALQREIGEILECDIAGHRTFLRRVKGTYDYEHGDKCICPICGSLGVPWGGLFHCEGNQGHKAIISTQQCFERVAKGKPHD